MPFAWGLRGKVTPISTLDPGGGAPGGERSEEMRSAKRVAGKDALV